MPAAHYWPFIILLYPPSALFGLTRQLIAEIGMGNGYELLYALCNGQAAEMCDAVLRDDIVHIVLARRADCAGRENGLYFADGAALCGGGKGNKALAATGLACAAYKIDLSAGTGEMPRADALRADLPPKVDLYGSIDRDNVVVAGDKVSVVDVVQRQYFHRRVIVDIIVYTL